jgi:hypothetical protein
MKLTALGMALISLSYIIYIIGNSNSYSIPFTLLLTVGTILFCYDIFFRFVR